MKKTKIYLTALLLFSLQIFTSCVDDKDLDIDNTLYITSLDMDFSKETAVHTRALNATTGYDGVVKRTFVANDVVTFYKNDTEACTAKYNGSGWTLSQPLQLVKGKRSVVKIVFNNMTTPTCQEAHAVAVYDKEQWVTTEEECWGSISSSAGALSAVLKYSKALVSIANITSLVGTVISAVPYIGNEPLALSDAPEDKRWKWETLVDEGKSITSFLVTLSDYTEIKVPVNNIFPLKAHKHYLFSISLMPGEYHAWADESSMGNPENWKPGNEIGNPDMVVISDVAGLKAMAENLNGRYILSNHIDITDENWIPIGEAGAPFTGEFDGNGYSIKNLNIGTEEQPAEHIYAGLFGYVQEARIVNTHVEMARIYNKGYAAGIIAGCAVNTEFDQCSTAPEQEAPVNTQDNNIIKIWPKDDAVKKIYAGGLIGLLDATGLTDYSRMTRSWLTYTNVYAIGTASQEETHSGGLVGCNKYGGFVSCYSYRTYTYAQGATTTGNNAGGFAGSSITDNRNTLAAFGCCAREVYAEAVGSAENNAGDFIAAINGAADANAILSSCWAWKNEDYGTYNYDDFIIKSVNTTTENCLGHNCEMSDYPQLYEAANKTFNKKEWSAKKIWKLTTAFPYVDLSYNGN